MDILFTFGLPVLVATGASAAGVYGYNRVKFWNIPNNTGPSGLEIISVGTVPAALALGFFYIFPQYGLEGLAAAGAILSVLNQYLRYNK
jgi:hypothetical protein